MAYTKSEYAWSARTALGPAYGGAQYVWGSLRIVLGSIFLWAFADKAFGLGFATAREAAWVNGGSPTMGFLKFGTAGPFAGFYQAIVGNVLVDTLFMLGLLGVGLALVLGMGVKVAGWSGALMMVLMWSAHLPPANNPLVDDHIIYALLLVGFALMPEVGRWVGFGRAWSESALVKRYPALQ